MHRGKAKGGRPTNDVERRTRLKLRSLIEKIFPKLTQRTVSKQLFDKKNNHHLDLRLCSKCNDIVTTSYTNPMSTWILFLLYCIRHRAETGRRK